MSKSRPEERVNGMFNPKIKYVENEVPEAWEIRHNGKPIILDSGKRLWKKKGHASAALKNHCYLDEHRVYKALIKKGYSYETAKEVSKKIYERWRDENIEFVRLA